MANRPKGYGMTAELANKKAAKYDQNLATDAFEWMREVLYDGDCAEEADSLPADLSDQKVVVSALKDGVTLCKLVNVIKPGSVKKINDSKMAFKMMENIGNFLLACDKLGIQKQDTFQSVDLYEGQNIPQVINGIIALGRKAQSPSIGYGGPAIGPREATSNPREFTDEQLRAGEGVIGLQAGSNKGATQSGQNFGKTRAIID